MVETKCVQELVYDSAMPEAAAPDRVPAGQVQHLVPALIAHLGKTTASTALEENFTDSEKAKFGNIKISETI